MIHMTPALIDDIPYPQHAHILRNSFKRAKTGLSYPPHKVLESVLDSDIVDYVRNTPVNGKTAFIFAAGNQGWMGTNGRYDQSPDTELHYKVKVPFIVLTNIYAGRIAAMFGSVNNLTLEFFGEAGASLQHAEEKEIKPSAFDSVNRGFFLGQGAVLAVFEKERAGMPKSTARLLGAYTASVELVKTHGTGTPVNNAAEKTALQRTLGNFIATSYKQRIGHTMGASGLLETCMLFKDAASGVVPAIANRTEHDSVFLSAPTPTPSGLVLSLAAGMGNAYSAAIFDRTGA